MTHLPKNPPCKWCRRAKMTHKHARSHAHPDWPTKFGSLTADWMIAKGDASLGIDSKRYCMLTYDLGTHFAQAYPTGMKDTQEAYLSLKHFAGLQKVVRIYSDRAGELSNAAKMLKWIHDKSLPYLHANNGIIERRNRIICRFCQR